MTSARKHARKIRRVAVARRHGMHHAWTILTEADRAGVPHALALAMVEQETGDGSNIFGHDPTIFIGAGKVTKSKYLAYKAQRGTTRMQGVGPLQLTWWSTQDAADKLGGCWKPRYNLRQGFLTLAANIKAHGQRDGIRRYNGSGPAAEAYASGVLTRKAIWRTRL
jgi:hypothetical protein